MGLGEALSLGSALAWTVAMIIYERQGETLPPLPLDFLKNLHVLGLSVFALQVPVPYLNGLGCHLSCPGCWVWR